MNRSTIAAIRSIFVLVLLTAVGACMPEPEPEEDICAPGSVQVCPCPGDAPDGTQVCEDDGQRWGACSCGQTSDAGDVESNDADTTSDAEDTDTNTTDTSSDTASDADATSRECTDDAYCKQNLGTSYACSLAGVCVENECTTDSDCTATFGDDSACSEAGVCSDLTCSTDSECTEAFGANNACSTDGTCKETGCSVDSDCIDAFGDGSKCSSSGSCTDSTCASDDDCTSQFGNDFVCSASDTCEDSTCSSDSECASRFPNRTTCADSGTCQDLNCATTTDCNTAFGPNFYCGSGGSCIDTNSPNCDDLYYAAGSNRDDVLVIGSIVPTTDGRFGTIGQSLVNAVRMALDEYHNSATDLPGGQTIAHLQCEGGSPAQAESAAAHLESVGSPVVIGPTTDDAYVSTVQNVTSISGSEVVTFAPIATSRSIGQLNASGTFSYQLIAHDGYQSSALVDRTRDLNSRSCTEVQSTECTNTSECQNAFGSDWTFDSGSTSEVCVDGQPRIVVFHNDLGYGAEMKSLLQSRFQQRYASATVDFYEFQSPATLNYSASAISSELASVASNAASAVSNADIAVFVGADPAVDLAVEFIDELETNGTDTSQKQYIFSHAAARPMSTAFSRLSQPASYLSRLEGVAPNTFNTTDSLFQHWLQRYLNAFGAPPRTNLASLFYDSTFEALFAMAAASVSGPVDASSVSSVLAAGRLQDSAANQISFTGSAFPAEARAQLQQGNNVDLIGVTGDLDFVFDSAVNQGTIRSNYIGFDSIEQSTPSGPVYEISPGRLYLLTPGEVYGLWTTL